MSAYSSFVLDMSEVRTLAADMSKVDERLTRHLIPVVRKGAVNIKNAIQADLRKSSNAGFRHVATTVSFDELDGGFGAEIGPTKPAGALANVAFFGTSRGGGTVRDPWHAVEDEEPGFIRELEKVAEGLVFG